MAAATAAAAAAGNWHASIIILFIFRNFSVLLRFCSLFTSSSSSLSHLFSGSHFLYRLGDFPLFCSFKLTV